jgi:hypothetical protein
MCLFACQMATVCLFFQASGGGHVDWLDYLRWLVDI